MSSVQKRKTRSTLSKVSSWMRYVWEATGSQSPSTIFSGLLARAQDHVNEIQDPNGPLLNHTRGEETVSLTLMASMLRSLPVQQPLPSLLANVEFAVPTPAQIDSLVRLHSQRVINTLHHSAHNSESVSTEADVQTWNIELCYPSGYSERFTFSNPTRRGVRNAKATETVEDIIRTVQVMLRYWVHSEQLRESLLLRLRASWNQNSSELFYGAINFVNKLMQEESLTRPKQVPQELVHRFFDQLYDRAVAPYTKNLNRGRDNCTYGELKPALLSKIFQQVGLNQHSQYLDMGSGIGNTVMQAALESGCEAHGMEIQHFAHLVGVNHLQQFHARCILWGLEPGQVQLYFGNFLHSPLIKDLLSTVDVVLVNNLKFDPTTDEQLESALERRLKVGAKVVSLRPILPVGRSRQTELPFKIEASQYEPDSVSWTNSGGTYYIATKQCVAR